MKFKFFVLKLLKYRCTEINLMFIYLFDMTLIMNCVQGEYSTLLKAIVVLSDKFGSGLIFNDSSGLHEAGRRGDLRRHPQGPEE